MTWVVASDVDAVLGGPHGAARLGFDAHLPETDLVVTGEGRIDDQTRFGKLPYVVARRAAPLPTYAVVGQNQVTPGSDLDRVFARIHPLSDVTDSDTRDDPGLTADVLTTLGVALGGRLLSAPRGQL